MYHAMFQCAIAAICAFVAILAFKAYQERTRAASQYKAAISTDELQSIASQLAASTYRHAIACGYSKRDARAKVRATIHARCAMLAPAAQRAAVEQGILNAIAEGI